MRVEYSDTITSNIQNKAIKNTLKKLIQGDKKLTRKIQALKTLKIEYNSMDEFFDALSNRNINKRIKIECESKPPLFKCKESKIDKTKFFNKLRDHKTPTTNENYLGIELEIIYPNDIDLRDLLYIQSKYVNISTDMSINGYDSDTHQSVELRICIQENQVPTIFKTILNKLNSIGAYVNSTCGLHVHIDSRHRKYTEVVNSLMKYEDILYLIQPTHRRENRYCFPSWTKSDEDSRYRGINQKSFHKHKTIEVRMCEASMDYKFISNWITLLTSIVDNKKLNKQLMNWITTRIKEVK